MPGDPLYGVKRQVEQIQVTLAGSEADQAEARLGLARTRMDELQALVEHSGGPVDEDVPALLEAWKEEVGRSSGVLLDMAINGDADARATLESFAADQSARLAGVVDALSGDATTRDVAQICLTVIEEMETQLRFSAMPISGSVGSPGEAGIQPSDDSAPSPSPTADPANTPTTPPSAPVLAPTPPLSPSHAATPSKPALAPPAPNPSDGLAVPSDPPTNPGLIITTTPPSGYSQLGPAPDGQSLDSTESSTLDGAP
jgi:hypothetical protein